MQATISPLVSGSGSVVSSGPFGTVPELLFEEKELLEWEQVYNTIRPHQTLGYVTPLKFLEQRKECPGKKALCHQSYERAHQLASFSIKVLQYSRHV